MLPGVTALSTRLHSRSQFRRIFAADRIQLLVGQQSITSFRLRRADKETVCAAQLPCPGMHTDSRSKTGFIVNTDIVARLDYNKTDIPLSTPCVRHAAAEAVPRCRLAANEPSSPLVQQALETGRPPESLQLIDLHGSRVSKSAGARIAAACAALCIQGDFRTNDLARGACARPRSAFRVRYPCARALQYRHSSCSTAQDL